jgi:hypothetical protein
MIRPKFDTRLFRKELNNIVEYATGFTEGVQRGKTEFLAYVGVNTIVGLQEYIDAFARVNPEALHHVYEWYQTGMESARLYDITFTVSNMGLSFLSSFKQSTSVSSTSTVPFANKAAVMESGTKVTIRPKNVNFLSFEIDGKRIFTEGPVVVDNPGGPSVAGSYEKVFDSFFTQYFTQAFLRSSGIFNYLENPVVFKKDLPQGKKMGRSKGISTGHRWIANGGMVK